MTSRIIQTVLFFSIFLCFEINRVQAQALDIVNAAGDTLLHVNNDGDVGIGTTNPSNKLQVLEASGTFTEGFSLALTGVNRAGFYLDASNKMHIVRGVTERVTIENNGNMGIGTTTPAAKLDVRGNIKLGTSGELFALGGAENLRIIRGFVSTNGSVTEGSGFTVQKPGTGIFLITYSPNFSDRATPVVTPVGGVGSTTIASIEGKVRKTPILGGLCNHYERIAA